MIDGDKSLQSHRMTLNVQNLNQTFNLTQYQFMLIHTCIYFFLKRVNNECALIVKNKHFATVESFLYVGVSVCGYPKSF